MERPFPDGILRKRMEPSMGPTLGEIGLNQFAPYLLNRISGYWNANMADALKAFEMSTTKMRAFAALSLFLDDHNHRIVGLRGDRTIDHEPHA